MGKRTHTILLAFQFAIVILSSLLFQTLQAEESVCAVVKIDIAQELTLERQGFEAELKIENTLVGKNLENIDINVNFINEYDEPVVATSDPNNLTAKFFIRVQSMSNIANVDGLGVIAGGQTAIVKWLIIPAPGASGGRERGTLYFVGADFNYVLDTVPDTISVAPDTIYVKPMPLLALDYFIPRNVFGDDPFTTAIEAPEPFSLGVRVKNNGTGLAKSLKIDSAQPSIVENEQSLLINYELLNSYVADAPVANTLLLDFGDIAADAAQVGRWQMQVSLNGRFTEFGASFTHADELGGALTSLLEATNTHFLIQDVVVDLPGRDGVRDFLVEDVTSPRVFESDGAVSTVLDQSAVSSFGSGQTVGVYERYQLSMPATAGLFYVQLTDPLAGVKELAYVQRSDGKTINAQNAWLSKVQNQTTHDYAYYVNLFDASGTDTYYFYYQVKEVVPLPPVIQFIPYYETYEGNALGFVVEASDPDGNPVSLTADPLPVGASFTDNANGTANFLWTPSVGQAGPYTITYSASDGTQVSYRSASIDVYSADDTDGDGLSDAWEMANFGNLDQDGTGDFDGDGISNLDEFINGTNPAVPNGPPSPTIYLPSVGGEATTLLVKLSVTNGLYDGPHSANLSYQFELYSDEAMTNRVDFYNAVPWDVGGVSAWTFSTELSDNTPYYWRARAYDGYTYSSWANSRFFVNTVNDLPSQPVLSSPTNGGNLEEIAPLLQVSNSTDVDGDTLYYEFFVYSDVALQTVVASSGMLNEGLSGMTDWSINVALVDTQTYYWQVTVTDEHSASVSSEVFAFIWTVVNIAPDTPVLISPINGVEVLTTAPVLEISTVVDTNGDQLTYIVQIDTVNTFNSVGLSEHSLLVNNLTLTQTLSLTGLSDNTTYYWRAKAVDSYAAESLWTAASSFFVNTVNDAPSTPTVNNPGDGSWVDSLTPLLQVNASTDIDNDVIRYEFEIYRDAAITDLVINAISSTSEYLAPILADNTWFYWRSRAVDNEGLASSWTAVSSFFVNDNNFDDPPVFTWVEPSTTLMVLADSDVLLQWDDADPDSSALIHLYYASDALGTNPVSIVNNIAEDSDGTADEYLWNIGPLSVGTYYLFADISDSTNTVTQSAVGLLEVIENTVIPGTIQYLVNATIYEKYSDVHADRIGIRLSKAPLADVVVPIINPLPGRLSFSASEVVFTPANWDVMQFVTIIATNNCIVDPNVQVDLVIGYASSTDPAFNNVMGGTSTIDVINDDAIVYALGNTVGDTKLDLISDNYRMCGSRYVGDAGPQEDGTVGSKYDIYIENIGSTNYQSVEIKATLRSTFQYSYMSDSNLNYARLSPGAIDSDSLVFNRPAGLFIGSLSNELNPFIYELEISAIK